MNKVYEDAITRIDFDMLPVSARDIAAMVRTLVSAARQRRADQAVARSLAEIGHQGLLADFDAARDFN